MDGVLVGVWVSGHVCEWLMCEGECGSVSE